MIFETNRLIVRKLRNSDISSFHKMQSNIDVMRYITGKTSDFEESRSKLQFWVESYSNRKMHWPYAVISKVENAFMGMCGIIDQNEVAYRLIPDFWNKGYGTELLNGLIDFSKTIGLKKLKALVLKENIGSYKILKNAGFELVEETICAHTELPEFIMQLDL